MPLPSTLILFLLMLPAVVHAQDNTPLSTASNTVPASSAPDQYTLPVGTPLSVKVPGHQPMRTGQSIRAELIYPVYNAGTLVLPAHTVVIGMVTALRSNTPRRVRASLGGDLTPFHTPVVSFNTILLADGTSLPFSSNPAADGAPIFRAVAPPPSKSGFIRRQWNAGLSIVRDDAAIFLAPGKADRFTQFIYGELPYHPQRIEMDTAWTIETTAPIQLQAQADPIAPAPPAITVKHHFWEQPIPESVAPSSDASKWIIQAYLDKPISSETSTTGEVIEATVAEPIYNLDHSVAIPQGATLVGAITKAKPSRSFGRTGILSFSFRQLTLPGGQPQNVETNLTGADSQQAIALNSEGQVKSQPQDKLSVPLLLAAMASRPLDHDAHDAGGRGLGKNAAGGAAGLGLVGTIVGLAGSSNAAAGIGYFGAAVAVYYRWIAHGKKIDFAKNTRIVVQAIPRNSAVLQPDPVRSN